MVRKHLAVYPYTIDDETAAFIASHYDLVDFDFIATEGIEKVKTLNPNIIMVGYREITFIDTYLEDWAEVNLHEDWFLHDINGNRLKNADYDSYAMDVGNPEWRDHQAQLVKAKLNERPWADGVFADSVFDRRTLDSNIFTVDPSLVPSSVKERWNTDIKGMLQYVKSVIGTKLLIINNTDFTGDFLSVADGMMLEGFIHGSWNGLYEYESEDYMLRLLDTIERLSFTGKYFMAQSDTGFPTAPTDSDLQQAHKIMLYCLGSFLLGTNGSKATFGWLSLHGAVRRGVPYHYPEMDIDVGNPTGSRTQVNADVWTRDFSKAKVFVNFSATNTYPVTVDGLVYTLPPHSSVIAPWEAPPIAPTIFDRAWSAFEEFSGRLNLPVPPKPAQPPKLPIEG